MVPKKTQIHIAASLRLASLPKYLSRSHFSVEVTVLTLSKYLCRKPAAMVARNLP